MWLSADYRPSALFSLKPGTATATGGKTLLIPTPFALRTALLDVAIRVEGVSQGPAAFDLIRDLNLAIRPPSHATVTNLFAKILKPVRKDKDRDEAMTSTIAFREYVHFQGKLSLAFEGETNALAEVADWLPHLTYLGRRGSFLQYLPPLREETALPDNFIQLAQPIVDDEGELVADTFSLGLMQVVDEWGPSLTYEKINVFEDSSIHRPGSGRDRLRYGVVIPYRLRRAGRGYSLYEHNTDAHTPPL